MYIKEGPIYNIWGLSFKTMNIDYNTRSLLRGKKFENLFPKVSSINQHSVATNPFSFLPITNFDLFIYFNALVFSFHGFFVRCCLFEPSKLVIPHLEALWESLVDLCISVSRTSKNLSQQSQTFCTILSFNYLNLKLFSMLVKESSLLILSIE